MTKRPLGVAPDEHVETLDVLAAIDRCLRALDDDGTGPREAVGGAPAIGGYVPGELPAYARCWSSGRFHGSGTFAPVGAVEFKQR